MISLVLHTDSLKINNLKGVKDFQKTKPNERPNDIINTINETSTKQTIGVFQTPLVTKTIHQDAYTNANKTHSPFHAKKFEDVIFDQNKAYINKQVWQKAKICKGTNIIDNNKIINDKVDTDTDEDKHFVSKLKKAVGNQFRNFKNTTKQNKNSTITTTTKIDSPDAKQ